jgi:hypothetical protein
METLASWLKLQPQYQGRATLLMMRLLLSQQKRTQAEALQSQLEIDCLRGLAARLLGQPGECEDWEAKMLYIMKDAVI